MVTPSAVSSAVTVGVGILTAAWTTSESPVTKSHDAQRLIPSRMSRPNTRRSDVTFDHPDYFWGRSFTRTSALVPSRSRTITKDYPGSGNPNHGVVLAPRSREVSFR